MTASPVLEAGKSRREREGPDPTSSTPHPQALLDDHLQAVDGEFAFATSEDASTVDEIQAFLDKSIKDGCEGLMVKMLEGEGASYEPSRRSIHWLKVRRPMRLSLSVSPARTRRH